MNQRYFIACIPDEPVYSEICSLTLQCSEKYHTQAALRSPPHLTIIPPFFYNDEQEHSLYAWLLSLLKDQQSVPVQLNGFDVFPGKVVFVNVLPSEALNQCQKKIADAFNQFIQDLRSYTFHPHMTIGFRDWTTEQFELASEEYRHLSFSAHCTIRHLSILKHDGIRWQEWQRVLFY